MIRNRKHASHPYLTAALMAAAAVPALAGAAAAQDKVLQGVTVTADEDTYKADVVSSPKQTQALVNTPKTIQVIRKEVIQEQQATTLMEALRNTPGITLQLGEGGNSTAGDAFQMRGFESSSALLVDGLRDRSVASRDTFNIEQIEVVKGAGGADSGRGLSSGYINVSTKQASLDDAASAAVGAYSQGGARASVDVNRAIGETSALRLNLMSQDIDTAGRDYVNRAGYGVGVAYGLGLETRTRFHLSGQYLNFDNTPDGGIPTIGIDGFYSTTPEFRSAPAVRRSNFYGGRNDYEKQEQGSVTAKFEHDFDAGIYFTNLTRWSNSSQERLLTGVSNPAASNATLPQADWTINRSRQREVNKTESFNNISNFSTSFQTGVLTHDLVFGFEYSDEKHEGRGVFSTTGTNTAANLYRPNAGDVVATPERSTASGTAYQFNRTKTASLYVFDTIKFGEKWLFNLGLRGDSYRLDYTAYNSAFVQSANIKANKSINAYSAGVVYKPVTNGSLYLSYATTQTPPGSASPPSASTTNINNPNVDPSETRNLEVGVKWEFFEGRLGLNGAWYKTNQVNASVGPDNNSDGVGDNYGDREITGVEISAVGKITDKWNITAAIQTMDDEVKDGTSPGQTSRWSPEVAATVWSTYQVSDKLKVGGGARYTGEQLRQTSLTADFATTSVPAIPEYWVVDAYAAYNLTDKIALQLNVYNLLDEDYISTLNNNAGRYTPGAPRSAALQLNYRF